MNKILKIVMGLFGFNNLMKATPEQTVKTRSFLRKALEPSVANLNEYTVVYAFYADEGLVKITYYNYAIAFSKKDYSIAIVNFTVEDLDKPESLKVGDCIFLKKDDIKSISRDLHHITTIKSDKFDTIKFGVQYHTSQNAESLYHFPINQLDVAQEFATWEKELANLIKK